MSVLRLAPKARLRFDRVRGRHVLLSPERGLVLNASAAAIVQACDGRSLDEVIEMLGRDIDRSTLERDVGAFVSELLQRGLVVET